MNDAAQHRKSVAILQSNYAPWRGYFDIIASVDEFILLDTVAYSTGDWRNRNRIKGANGPSWITIPVSQKNGMQIRDVKIANQRWRKKHWKTFESSYRKAPYFDWVAEWLKPKILDEDYQYLSEWNTSLIKAVCKAIGVNTPISHSHSFDLCVGKNERIISLCKQLKATHYVSGPSAKNYINLDMFANQGIKIEWFDYSGYPKYQQLWGDFLPEVSILDLLFNCGPHAPKYMKHSIKRLPGVEFAK